MTFKRQKVDVYGIKDTPSYHLMKVDDKYYIIDIDRPLIVMQLFPFLEWLLPHKFYPITKKQFEYVRTHFSMPMPLKFGETMGITFGIYALWKLAYKLFLNLFNMQILPLFLIIVGVIIAMILRSMFFGKISLPLEIKTRPLKGWLFPTIVENMNPLLGGIIFMLFLEYGSLWQLI